MNLSSCLHSPGSGASSLKKFTVYSDPIFLRPGEVHNRCSGSSVEEEEAALRILNTVDGRNPANQLIGSLSQYL